MDFDLQRRVQPDVERRPASTSCARRRWRRSRTWARGRSAPTTPPSATCPEPGAGSIQARRPIPQLSRINAIRFDGKSIYHGVTFKVERRLAEPLRLQRQLHAVALQGRRVEPGRHGVGSESSRRTCGTSSTRPANGRPRASTTATSSSPAASTSCRSSANAGGVAKAVLGGWRANAIFIAQAGAPFTVNLGVDRANIGAGPAQRPDQLGDPQPPRQASGRPSAGSTRRRSHCRAPFTFGSAPRNSVIGPGYANVDFALAKTWALGGARSSSSGGRCSTCSTARTSICRTGSSATRTSAASSARRARVRCSSACASPSSVPGSKFADRFSERGARMARRDDREYREYLREEQRRQPGCPARKMSANF